MKLASCSEVFSLARAFVIVAFTIGCGDPKASVSGIVLLDGSPIEIAENQRGTLVFHPEAGGATCTSLIGQGGTFSLSMGASGTITPGEYRVTAQVIELISGADGEPPSGKPTLLPAVYANPITSGLVYETKPGVMQIRIELDSSVGPIESPEPSKEAEPVAEELGESESANAVDGANPAAGAELDGSKADLSDEAVGVDESEEVTATSEVASEGDNL